ncbi:MAG TPA: crosslink repair DNA glycosylase YcaQ family protein [Terriglobia bacterium]|nr:crosslink repair DNA glycosylase YcaQ family protein [Terriglobia bacterium]
MDTALQAERFIEHVGFTACLTDTRRPGPSLYVAVCGRRDVVMPRNVQKDPECSQAWRLKDEVMRRGRVYYAKLGRGQAMFVAPRMVPYFNALWGVRRRAEKKTFSNAALAVLRVLRKEWEMGTADLRAESGVSDRRRFLQAVDELQAAMIVIPSEAVYEPKFTYLWALAEERFPAELARRIDRRTALREVARCFLDGAGLTVPGELARVTGLSRPEAGLGNRALVKEGYAVMIGPGTYVLSGFAVPAPKSMM